MSFHPDHLPPVQHASACRLQDIYRSLYLAFGPQHWWPASTPFEMAVGAILTQNTAWANVERALANLNSAAVLTIRHIHALDRGRLEELIRPAGFFRQKSERLQLFTGHLLDHHDGELLHLLAQPTEQARQELLALKGIGPETADSILLYAGNHPSFVIDAYTRRILARLDCGPAAPDYETLRHFFMQHLPASAPLYNEYHALLVQLAKEYCRKRSPRCVACPLLHGCPSGLSGCRENLS